MGRLLGLLPLLLLLSACSIPVFAEEEQEEDPVATGCVYFGNLARHLDSEMAGLAEPLEYSIRAYIVYYRDEHFIDDPKLTGAANALQRVLFSDVINDGFDAWRGVSAARQIARLCAAYGHDHSIYSPDVIMEYFCAGPRQTFGYVSGMNPAKNRSGWCSPRPDPFGYDHEHQDRY